MNDVIWDNKANNPIYMELLKEELESKEFEDAFYKSVEIFNKVYFEKLIYVPFDEKQMALEEFKLGFYENAKDDINGIELSEVLYIYHFLNEFKICYNSKTEKEHLSYVLTILNEQIKAVEDYIIAKSNFITELKLKGKGHIDNNKIVGLQPSDLDEVMLEYVNVTEPKSELFKKLCKQINMFYDDEAYDAKWLLASYNIMRNKLIRFYKI